MPFNSLTFLLFFGIVLALHQLPLSWRQKKLNLLLASYLEARLDPARARELSLVIAGRSLLGMVLFVFLTQEVLGAGRFLEVSEDELTETIARLFLAGVKPDAEADSA